jgi:hypothetical protein
VLLVESANEQLDYVAGFLVTHFIIDLNSIIL